MKEQEIFVHLFESPEFPVVPTDANSAYLGDGTGRFLPRNAPGNS